jgi:8-oxo-dGTP pyrophosphatase MutT (NUDIX family)
MRAKFDDAEGQLWASDPFDLDSVAAIFFTNDGHYLLQHREKRPDISHPNMWCLFGGAREHDERAEDALRREVMEELGVHVRECTPFLTCTFAAWREGRLTRKTFFAVPATEQDAQSMVLREGQGMAWLDFAEILARGDQIVPYDLGAIALHRNGAL